MACTNFNYIIFPQGQIIYQNGKNYHFLIDFWIIRTINGLKKNANEKQQNKKSKNKFDLKDNPKLIVLFENEPSLLIQGHHNYLLFLTHL